MANEKEMSLLILTSIYNVLKVDCSDLGLFSTKVWQSRPKNVKESISSITRRMRLFFSFLAQCDMY